MFSILDDVQKENICNRIEIMFATPSIKDGACGIFTMPEVLIKERAAYFNECILTVYEVLHSGDSHICMFEVISSLDSFFDLDFLVKNVLSEDILDIIVDEIMDDLMINNKMSRLDISKSSLPPSIQEKIMERFNKREEKV